MTIIPLNLTPKHCIVVNVVVSIGMCSHLLAEVIKFSCSKCGGEKNPDLLYNNS